VINKNNHGGGGGVHCSGRIAGTGEMKVNGFIVLYLSALYQLLTVFSVERYRHSWGRPLAFQYFEAKVHAHNGPV
jgi:hypothetical protein